MINKEKINWGIISTGEIATRMATALGYVNDAELLAVSSRSKEKADAFASKFNISRSYGSYEELVKDPDIDLVYIGTPHVCHYENMLLCLNNGKNVLCEKPFALNYKQAAELVELAKRKNLFLMEAHWSYFLPGIKKIKELIQNDIIGKLILLKADFCVKQPFLREHRWFNPKLGGGALLDVGVYPVSFALSMLGYPIDIKVNTIIGKTGVDVFNAITLKHENDSTSLLCCSINTNAPREALIVGEKGYIKVHEPFHHAPKITLKIGTNDPIEIETPFQGNGYNYEAEQVNSYLKQGKIECSEFPLEKTLEVLKITDHIRKQSNLQYPQESSIKI